MAPSEILWGVCCNPSRRAAAQGSRAACWAADLAAERQAELWALRSAVAAQEAQVLRGRSDAAALTQLRRDAAGNMQVPEPPPKHCSRLLSECFREKAGGWRARGGGGGQSECTTFYTFPVNKLGGCPACPQAIELLKADLRHVHQEHASLREQLRTAHAELAALSSAAAAAPLSGALPAELPQ